MRSYSAAAAAFYVFLAAPAQADQVRFTGDTTASETLIKDALRNIQLVMLSYNDCPTLERVEASVLTDYKPKDMATRPEATNFGLLQLENARSVNDVLALAPGVGIPGQNLVVGDVGGRIAWTLLGRVPRGSVYESYSGNLGFFSGGPM